MPKTLRQWAATLMVAAGLTSAGPGMAADEPVPSAQGAPPAATGVKDPPPKSPPNPSQPTTQSRPADTPPDRPKTKPRPLQTFRPSEEIHVDKAVDFPADI